MRMLKRLAVCAACICMGGAASATTLVYTNSYSAVTNGFNAPASWGHLWHWTNTTGAVVTVAPTNGEDVVFGKLESRASIYSRQFSEGTGNTRKVPIATLSTGQSGSGSVISFPAVNPIVNTITGEETHRFIIRHTEAVSGYNADVANGRVFTIYDPSGFQGFWTTLAPYAQFKLPATASHTPKMGDVSARYRPYINVPDAGTTAEVASFYDHGSVTKIGAGKLVVKAEGANGGQVHYVKNGTIEYENSPSMEPLLEQAALHFDASDDTTYLTTTNDVWDAHDGRTYVTNWMDVRKNGFFAEKSNYRGSSNGQLARAQYPFVSAVQSPTKKPLIDFGSTYLADKSIYGPTGCCLKVTQGGGLFREFFFVVAMPYGKVGACLMGVRELAGAAGSYPFQHNEDKSRDTRLLNAVYADSALLNPSDLMVNGKKCADTWSCAPENGGFTNLFVMSIAPWEPVGVNLLATDGYHSQRTGGVRYGEIICFTNALTHAERVAINRYLIEKWLGPTGQDEGVTAVKLDAETATISVPEGHTAQVHDLVGHFAYNATTFAITPKPIIKEGAGTLVVSAVEPAGAKVQIKAGAVIFAPEETIDDTQPAANPYIWLDANDAGSIDKTGDYVTKWHDTRDAYAETRYFTREGTSATTYPIVVDATNGLKGVSMRNTIDGANSIMHASFHNQTIIKAAFAMVRPIQSGNENPAVFGGNGMELNREGTRNRLASASYPIAKTYSRIWTVNGMPIDPIVEACIPWVRNYNNFYLNAFNGTDAVEFDELCGYRHVVTDPCVYGEVIAYTRELTDAERRQTEAYLMKRWLKQQHPAIAPRVVDAMEIASNVDVVVGGDRDVTIGQLTGGSGRLVKTGTGATTIGSALTNVTTVTVQAGSTLSAQGAFDWEQQAALHYDATDLASFTDTFVGTGSDGKVVTNIVTWQDTRANGKYATAVLDGIATTNPVLKTVEVASGIYRTMVDFGAFTNTIDKSYSETGRAAAMRMNSGTKLLTAFAIFADAHGSKRATIFSNTSPTETDSFSRGSDGRIIAADGSNPRSAGVVRNSSQWLDGASAAITTVPTDGCHLMTSRVEDKWTSQYYQTINAFANQGKVHAGGILMGEQVAFYERLTEQERKFVEGALMHKWFGTSPVLWTNTLDSVTLEQGATFALSSEHQLLKLSSFTGSGTIKVEAIDGLSSLSFVWRSKTDYDSLTASGSVKILPGATIRVDSSASELPAGDYVLVEAENLDFDPTACTLVTTFASTRAATLVKDGNRVVLRVYKKGAAIYAL